MPRHYKARQIFQMPQLGIHTSRHLLNAPTLLHDHDFFEIVLIVGGAGIHVSAGSEQSVGAGDGWILAPGAWHAYRECQNLEVYNCCFAPALLERELAALRHDVAANHIFFQGSLALERRGVMPFDCSAPAFLDFWHALHESPTALERVAHLLLFLGQLTSTLSVPRRTPLEKKPHPAVPEVMRLLEAQIQKAWTLPEIARAVHLTPGYLARIFKEATGVTPMIWLHRLRCENAARFLLQTQWPIAQIGARVGWDDPNLFARRFRAAYGVSATQYRARFR